MTTLLHHPSQSSVAERRRFQWRGAMGAIILAPCAFVTIFSTPVVREDSALGYALNASAWIVFVSGATLRFWATIYISGRKERRVVSDGPYSLCRHPLYLGSLLLAISGALFLKSLTFAGALLLVTLVYALGTVPIEEQYLRTRYPSEFEEYRRRVRRYRPSMRSFRTSETIAVSLPGLWLECARASRWIWLPPAGIVVAHLRAQHWWPHLFRLL